MYLGAWEIVELLLKAGATVNATEEDNWTPLHIAVQHRTINISTKFYH